MNLMSYVSGTICPRTDLRLLLPQCGHKRQEPFLVAHKTYTKTSTFVKYVIKLVDCEPYFKFKVSRTTCDKQ